MARPKRKYETKEEALEANRRRNRDYYTRPTPANQKNSKNPNIWGSAVYRMPGLTIELGTVKKSNPETVFIDCSVTYKHTTDLDAVRCLKEDVRKMLKARIDEQVEYDKKNFILVIEAFDSSIDEFNEHRNRNGKWKHLTFQLHLKKIGRPFTWVETVDYVTPIMLDIRERLIQLLADNGLELKSRKDSSSVTAQPETS